MRSPSSAYQTAIAADEVKLVTLVDIRTDTPILRALHDGPAISFDSATYLADSGGFSEIKQSAEAERSRLELSLQNVTDPADDTTSRPWTSYLNANNINGTEVKFRWVLTDDLATTTSVILEQRWYISGWRLDQGFVRFGVGSPFDILGLSVPSRPLVSRACGLLYKKGACTSQSAETACPKTPVACSKRFGPAARLAIGPSFPFTVTGTRRAG